MNRALGISAVVVVCVGACRFDGGGLQGDDVPGDDDVDVDADPGAPDADPGAPDARRPDAMPAPDAAPEPPPGTLVAKPAVGAVTLDGASGEFAAAGAEFATYAIADGQLYDAFNVSYTPSSTVRFAAIHDASAIYLFAEVTDSIQQYDSTSIWHDDAVTFYLDVAGDASGPFDADDHELVIRGDGEWGDFGPVGTAATVTVGTAATGTTYRVEVRVEKDSLSATVGDTIGFDVGLGDDDGFSNDELDAWSMWFKSSRPECATCCQSETANYPWCDTSLYGTLVLE